MFTEDLTPFFNASDFAVAATYGAAETAISVIFDADYLEQRDVAGTNPVALARTADVPTPAEGELLVVAGAPYTIRGWEPDGTGITLLQLEAYPANGFDRGFDAGFGD